MAQNSSPQNQASHIRTGQMGQIQPHHNRHTSPSMDHLCRESSRMGAGSYHPDSHTKQSNRQSTKNGGQADPRAQQHEPMANPLPRIGLANMELTNGITENEAIPAAAHHREHHLESNPRQKQIHPRRLVVNNGITNKRSIPSRAPHPNHKMAMYAATMGGGPKTIRQRGAQL